MIKRGLIFFIVCLISISLISAATNTSTSDSAKVEKAYTCLQNKINNKCSDLSTEEKIFSLLAISQCKNELLDDSQNEECWPDLSCNVKTTSQAILALDRAGYDTENAETWLLSQTINPPDVRWYLEIIPKQEGSATCTISYDSIEHSIKIDEDNKINVDAGSCLNLANNDYWLQVSEDCYGKEFTVSCSKDFLTTLLYKKKTNSNSSTIYVSEKVSSAVAEGKTTESINSYCFKKGSSCDYEASLWAALVLDSRKIDISPYLPYLVTMADSNEKYMPDAFLYLLTGSTDYQVNLISKQTSGYWDFSGNKFYDTSLAMLSFKDETEKTNAENWFLQTQASDGCWQDSIRDTAFILYSTWPKTTTTKADCEDKGYFCMSSKNCNTIEGSSLDYSCSGASICCDKNVEKTCDEQAGKICSSGESCIGGTYLDASDTKTGQSCCYNGDCEKTTAEISNCEKNNGVCKSSCNTDESSVNYSCTNSGNICCLKKTTTSIFGAWWIWVLLILIILVIVGIIFKDWLRMLWFRFGAGKNSSAPSSSGQGPRFLPPPSQLPQRIIPRRILPPSQQSRRPMPRQSDEFSDILKKLKDIGR